MEINPGFEQVVLNEIKRGDAWRKYRMEWDNLPKYNVVNLVPVHLDLETTTRCQLKCPGCPSQKVEFGKGDMPLETALCAIREFASLGGRSIKLNWRGEPTMYPYLTGLVKCAKDEGILDILINTNGIAVTPKLAKKLVDAGLTTCIFSIDSIVPSTYEKLRVGATLDRALTGLMSMCLAANDDLFIRVQRIAYPELRNQEPFNEFVDFFKTGFRRVNSVAQNHYKEKTMEGDTSCPSNPCAQPWQRLLITYDGYAGPCCEMNRFKEGTFGKFPDRKLSELWNSLALQSLRVMHSKGKQNDINACKRCTVTKPSGRVC